MTGTAVRLGALRDAARTQLWPLPTFGVLLALGLGVLLPRVDARVAEDLPPAVTGYLFGGGPGAARTVLDAIASSLITVTALTFSLTVVTLQLASSQFSPRLLRTFLRDRFVHATLALFLATFTYALTVLRTVRTGDDGVMPFVPQLSVTVAFLLTLASVLALVLFLAHLATEIRVETMLKNVHRDASDVVRRVLGPPGDRADRKADRDRDGDIASARPPAHAWPVPAGASGFLVRIDEQALLSAAVQADAVVLLDRYPGNVVVAGTPIAAVWPRRPASSPSDSDGETTRRLAERVAAGVSTGPERTSEQDIGFGLRQLVDVTSKALSPGINDPTTAVHALGHCAVLLCELAGYDLGPRLLHDEQHRVRVVLRRPVFAELLELAIAQPRRYGAADPVVLARLFTLLREVAWSVGQPEQRAAVTEQLVRLRATADGQDFDEWERQRLAGMAEQVEQALAGRWTPGTSPD